ncbi:PAS domain S-box-containing protein [Desulfotomaculum arcticum]|uniref:PAS domain S-box-containing protein n=1 Tax=Desulfotruncus arcticus DSM 17038 TaxID=1121424 RepID=A0A1I2TDH6_9FIRM|nr:sigma 54-interacting transcriptional regulator [Desulfotruncus arcticus]SFG62983.1 PAS domain S-box-containing protein [Desulfotomaculum arcticum] [Desulfotruncus arcticus DSM 17038]
MRQDLEITFKAMINSIGDGIYMTDSEGYCIAYNEAFLRITGITNEIMGQHVSTLLVANLISDSVTIETIRSRQRVSKVIIYPSGCEALVTGNPVFDEHGNLVNVVCVVRDLSELNALKDELKLTKKLNKQYQEILKNFSPILNVTQEKIIVRDPKMQSILDMIPRIAASDATVLVYGESGVGKGLIASLIHEHSGRAEKGQFIKVDCAAIPSSLLESELFGYDRGAFTGARREGKPGLLEMANNGTVFLDEIGELPLFMQVKLLNVLQDRKIQHVGGTHPVPVDIRIVSATNRDLERMVDEGIFRQDLFYRLNVVPVVIPPLRDRKEDILVLALSFWDKFCQKYQRTLSLSPKAMDCLCDFSWPGNVRELENTIERLVVLGSTGLIKKEDLPEKIRQTFPIALVNNPFRPVDSGMLPLKAAIAVTERQLIERALLHNDRLGPAAESLGIDISTLLRKCKKLGIKRAKT